MTDYRRIVMDKDRKIAELYQQLKEAQLRAYDLEIELDELSKRLPIEEHAKVIAKVEQRIKETTC